MYDRKPERHKPIETAAALLRRADDQDSLPAQAAVAIRDLLALAKALDNICAAYRIGGRPREKSLDIVREHSWMIRDT